MLHRRIAFLVVLSGAGAALALTNDAQRTITVDGRQVLPVPRAHQPSPLTLAKRERLLKYSASHSGDPIRGRQLFAKCRCDGCHTINSPEPHYWPDLGGIGLRYKRSDLALSILFPAQRIAPHYQTVLVLTSDGHYVAGHLWRDAKDHVEVIDESDRLIRFHRSEIDHIYLNSTSDMQEGLVDGLTPDQFASLIAFLATLQDAPPKEALAQGVQH